MSFKVLVTGAKGFTGRYLCEYLQNLDYEILKLDTNNCDILDIESIKKIIQEKPDFVIHLAGIAFAPSDPTLIENVNVNGSKNLLDAIKYLNLKPKRVILASSASVYGIQNDEVLSEHLQVNPLSPYAKSKWQMEQLAQNYDFDVLITRPFNYTGLGQNENFLIPKIVSHFKQKKDVIELGNLMPKREYNNVLDVVKIYKKLLNLNCSEKIFNIGSSKAYSVNDILNLMREISGRDIKVTQNPNFMRKDDAQKIVCDTKLLEKYKINLCNTDIKDTLKWMYER